MMWSFNDIMDMNVGLKWSKALKGNIIFTCYDVPAANRVGFPSCIHGIEKLHLATMARACW
jgi:hypothetical protein